MPTATSRMNYRREDVTYEARIDYDDEASILHGEVINLRDVITFQGRSVEELKQAFKDSVEDYLEFCAERGETPEKPYSGRFLVRIDPGLHRVIFQLAQRQGLSLNTWIAQTLESAAPKPRSSGSVSDAVIVTVTPKATVSASSPPADPVSRRPQSRSGRSRPL